MALMKTSNPALNINRFRADQTVPGEATTLTGTINKTGFCRSAWCRLRRGVGVGFSTTLLQMRFCQ
jgi:hypothetical protein